MLGWLVNEIERENRSGGGGGRPQIRLGKTGPRGRMYGKAATAPKGTTAIAKSKFIKVGKGSRSAIREHLRYVQERERGEDEPERKFFDRERRGIERQEVFEAMLENRGNRAAMHTLILSPGDNNVNMEEYTRESMKALEERMGHELDWYATIHQNTDHYHAHVVIAGKIPDRERQLEKEQAKEWEREYNKGVEREFAWTNREAELRELLGKGYDERPVLDPREERQLEREFGYGSEGEETDPRVKDLIGDETRSPEELRFERMMERYEWQLGAKDQARERGDVYLDKDDLKELRHAGNDYVERERSMDRSIERAYEREFGREMEMPERERTREYEDRNWSEISREFVVERELEREMDQGYDRGRGDDDDSFGRSRGDRSWHEEREERGRDDEMDRGRGFGR